VSTAFWYGLYFVAVRQARATQSATRVMLWSSLAVAPILLLVAILLKEPLVPSDPMLWAPLAALGLVHVLGQGSIAWALGRLPTATAALVVLVQPVAAALLAYAVFGEAMTPLQSLGGVLALAGVVIAQWKGKAAPTEAAEA
jgi:drug/metabolite transporter (DMT)-like permease